jgi:hypothetical protein
MTNRTPPLLPEETLRRVLRVANFDGMSVLAVAGILALASASVGDFYGAAVGLLVAAAGAIELHGAALLQAKESRGMNWLLASQPYLLAIVVGYCAVRLTNYDPTLLRRAMTDETRASLAEAGFSEEQFLRLANTLTFAVLAAVTLVYQGGMVIYYLRRRRAVFTATEGNSDDGK